MEKKQVIMNQVILKEGQMCNKVAIIKRGEFEVVKRLVKQTNEGFNP